MLLVTPQIEKAETVNAYVKLTSQLSSGSEVESVEQYLEATMLTHEVTPTSNSITVGDFRLTGYEITGTEPVLIFASVDSRRR